MSFSDFGLSEDIMFGIESFGYEKPTEIQSSVIPIALEGYDVIGCAPTGTGKTAAFVLPILQIISETVQETGKRFRLPQALILAPTRELALQTQEFISTFEHFTGINSVTLYGGVSLSNQIRALEKGADIIIATPGRLLDLMYRGFAVLSNVDILVLDEADRMYDMGFIHDVRKIVKATPRDRQTLLFSATMSHEIRDLVGEIQRDDAKFIEIGEPFTPVDSIKQQAISIPQPLKTALLEFIIKQEDVRRMLVFSKTKHGADRIARSLARDGISSMVIHSNRSMAQRRDALEGFRKDRCRVLVATDLAARGIDVEGITHVVNFDTPGFAEDYIHRIGRTGRAEAEGIALTFVSPEEEPFLKRIQYHTGKRLQLIKYPGFNYPEEKTAGKEKKPFFQQGKSSYYRKPSMAWR